MIAAIGTLAFLTTLWLLAVIGAVVLEESGAKIAAALKGDLSTVTPATVRPMRLRARAHVHRPIRATAQWRAAA
jgi:hypothetical protein